MDYIVTSFNEEQQKGYVVIQVSSTGIDEKEQYELRNEITKAIGKNMNKQELIREIKKSSESEGFITASQFARFIGVSNVSQCKYKYLSGLERVDGKYYFIPDVANVLMGRVDSTG